MGNKLMSRLTGKITHRDTGSRKKFFSGWRDFDPLHPDVTNNGLPNSQLGSITVNSSRQIVATYADVISTAGETLPGADVFAIPLTNKDGRRITFADSFILKTQIEIISTSGDIDNVTNHSRPYFGLALGQTADAADSSNHYIGAGFYVHDSNANGVVPRTAFFKTTAANTHSDVHDNDSSNVNTTFQHFLCDYYIGPAIGSALAEPDTVVIANWVGKNQTGNYDQVNSNYGAHEFNNEAGVFDGDGQVFLYAYFGVKTTLDGSQDPAVVTTRMRYMVNANDGKDGTATV
tara:strand:+ start:1074 stop:1943 length:870 start_codon:yes stop_codon:yes gene_type:complete